MAKRQHKLTTVIDDCTLPYFPFNAEKDVTLHKLGNKHAENGLNGRSRHRLRYLMCPYQLVDDMKPLLFHTVHLIQCAYILYTTMRYINRRFTYLLTVRL